MIPKFGLGASLALVLVSTGTLVLSLTTRPRSVFSWPGQFWSTIIIWNGRITLLEAVPGEGVDVDDTAMRAQADKYRQMIDTPAARRFLGFYWHDISMLTLSAGTSAERPLIRHRRFDLPLWFPIAVSTLISVGLLIRPIRRRSYRRQGRCSRCGYDLTGNESGTCPECGTEVKA